MVKLLYRSFDDYTEADFVDMERLYRSELKAFGVEPWGGRFPPGLTIEVAGRRPPADFFKIGSYMVGSRQLVDILRSLGTDAEFFKVTALSGPGKASESDFFVIHVLDAPACIDLNKSKVTMESIPGFQDHVRRIKKLVLLDDVVRGHHLFRVGKCSEPIFCVSDEFAQQVAEHKLTGICLLEPSQYGRQYELCRKERQTKRSQTGKSDSPPARRSRKPPAKPRGRKKRVGVVQQIEEALGVAIPKTYAEFLADYASHPERLAGPPGSDLEAFRKLFCYDSPDAVIRVNLDLRQPGYEWTDEGGPWPDQYLAIGEDGGGNYWAVDLNSRGEPVYVYDHESGTFEARHASLSEFAASVRERLESLADSN